MRGVAAFTFALLFWPSLAFGQTQQPEFEETPAGRRAQYNAEVLGLAEELGFAHYLRTLCAGRGDQSWRGFMRDLLAQEGPRRRVVLTQAFNRGYRGAEERFPACSPGARQAEEEAKARGMRLADTLAARHRD